MRWTTSILLFIFILGFNANPVAASPNEGNFVPCAQAVSSVKQDRTVLYQVRKGDTLWAISKTFNVDLAYLTSMNQLSEGKTLDIGQNLKIPGNSSPVHLVKKGETFWSIALSYGIAVDELQKLNAGQDPGKLKIGDAVNIPAGIQRKTSNIEPSRSLSTSRLFFTWPLFGVITSAYGWRQSGFHHGLDIAGKMGDPIKASASGLVSFTGTKAVYGRTVILDHPDGRQTLYAHTQKIYVREGQEVQRGDTIAAVGTSGYTTGPHLHFEIRSGDKTLNPSKYLR